MEWANLSWNGSLTSAANIGSLVTNANEVYWQSVQEERTKRNTTKAAKKERPSVMESQGQKLPRRQELDDHWQRSCALSKVLMELVHRCKHRCRSRVGLQTRRGLKWESTVIQGCKQVPQQMGFSLP
eukprot:5365719-Amphidinium_carterae.1